MKQLLLPVALALGLLAQCRPAEPTPAPPVDPLSLLPAEAQSGVGTFGCLINGQAMSVKSAFLAQGDWDGPRSLRLLGATSATQPDYAAQILLVGQLENNQTFALNSLQKLRIGGANEFGATFTTNQYTCRYQGNEIRTGQLTLTKFDGVGRVASGRFAFTLYQPGGCDTLRVTNGRFDVKF